MPTSPIVPPRSVAAPTAAGANPAILSVGQLNRLARQLLEECFALVWVEGEISNLSQPASGHWYFTLKDDQAQVRCAMFRNRNFRLRFRPQNGDRVLVRGKLSLYENRGDYQLIAEEMAPAGAGLLAVRFEALKQQLQTEGLFAPERKRPLPATPHHVAVITSPTGAAIRDILHVMARRCPSTRLTLVPVPVQGEQSAPAIVQALQRVNRLAASGALDCEVILLGRGGGSLEDLWSFNEESVARAIAASVLPVVSAVGHETDTTIADLVADCRAPTPSAGAELLSPDCEVWRRRLAQSRQRLTAQWQRLQQHRRQQLAQLRRRVQHPGQRLQQRALRLDELEGRLRRARQQEMARRRHRLELLHSRLRRHQPGQRLAALRARLDHAANALLRESGRAVLLRRARLNQAAQLLNGVSPLATLQRGYAIVTDTLTGAVLRQADTVTPGQLIEARLAKGVLRCRVEVTVPSEDPAEPRTCKE